MPSKTEIYIYFIFTPKYRKELLTHAVRDTIQWAIYDQAEQMGINVITLAIKPHHLHLLVKLPPDISVSKAAGMLKWRSSIVARKQHLELKEIKAFWGRRYFARSVSPVNLHQARKYVEGK